MATTDPNTDLQNLRNRAERRRLVTKSVAPDAPAADVQRLVQELQVHQIELEMQYEELLAAQTDAESSRAAYMDLYDFAPMGYCTLAADGTLLQLNLRLSQLLGRTRQQVQGRRLGLFIAPDERGKFAEFLGRLWATPDQRQTCELALQPADQPRPLYVQLEGSAPTEAPGQPPAACRLAVLDVTARRYATDELAASEARFRATFEQSRDGMVLLENQCFVDLNAAALHLLGRPDKHEVVGHHVAEFWPERQPDGGFSMSLFTQCLAQATKQGWCRLEWMRYAPGGQAVWDEMSFSPVLVNGQPLMHAAWRDVTARKLNERRLRESEETLQTALTSSGTGVWTWELATDHLGQDDRTRAIFALPTYPSTMADLQATVHPDDWPSVQEAFQRARDTHTSFEHGHRLVLPSGEVRHAATSGRFVYDEQTNAPLRLAGLVRDVTAHQVAQERLTYKNRLLNNILQNLPVLLSRVGADGRYRELTGRALARFGLASGALTGEIAHELVEETAAAEPREGESYLISTKHNGQPVYLQACNFFDAAQQEKVTFAIDITDSEHLKQEAIWLKLRQQQEVLSAILTTQEEERRRIAEALHNGVGQLLYATRLHIDALPTSEQVRAVQQLLVEAIRATRTISFELTPGILEDFGLPVALRELVKLVPARHLAVDLNLHGLEAPLPAPLEIAVYRMVQELLNNVMKHAKAREIFVQVAHEDNQIHISVEDDGVGFEPGAVAPGIGLAGIRTRVGLLGGSVVIKSRLGQGTGVFLTLPVPRATNEIL